jgi:hypothetical protein
MSPSPEHSASVSDDAHDSLVRIRRLSGSYDVRTAATPGVQMQSRQTPDDTLLGRLDLALEER